MTYKITINIFDNEIQLYLYIIKSVMVFDYPQLLNY